MAHQFYTWTRTVENHTVGSTQFNYPKNLPGIASYAKATKPWEQNQYFLSGVLGALDTEGEWFLDKGAGGVLYFWPPSSTCAPPTKSVLEIKTRDYALTLGMGSRGVTVDGLEFRGATLRAAECTHCVFSNLAFDHPTYNSEILEMNAPPNKGKVASTLIAGNFIRVENVSLGNTNNHGLSLSGDGVALTNAVISYTGSLGTLTYVPLAVEGNHVNVSRCTVAYFGNAGVTTHIPNTPPAKDPNAPPPVPQPMFNRSMIVSHNHIHHGGLIGKDSALLYTGGWTSAGPSRFCGMLFSDRTRCVAQLRPECSFLLECSAIS